MIYIHKEQGFWDVSEVLPNNYLTGSTLEEYNKGSYLLLSDEQVAFHEAHPNAGPVECWNMQFDQERLLQTAKDLKRQEVYNTDYRHYYIDDNDAYTYDRLSLKDQCTRKDTVEVNGKLYKSALLLEALNEMADYNDICIGLSEKLLSDIEAAETVEDVEAIEVTGYPDVIHRTTDELQEAVKYTESHDSEKQLSRITRKSVSAMSLTDDEAISAKYAHAEWKEFINGKLETGNRVINDDWLWKVRQPINPVLEIYPPSVDTAALYERMDENHKGTEYDPKLYAPGKVLHQDGRWCKKEVLLFLRDDRSGICKLKTID